MIGCGDQEIERYGLTGLCNKRPRNSQKPFGADGRLFAGRMWDFAKIFSLRDTPGPSVSDFRRYLAIRIAQQRHAAPPGRNPVTLLLQAFSRPEVLCFIV